MKRARHVVAIAIVALASATLPNGSAGADAPTEWGYWWKAQAGVGPHVEPPPFVPPDGLWVAADPSGDQAVSAVRFDVPPGVTPTALTLRAADVRGSPAIRACPTGSEWSAVSAGAWDSRPTSDCDGSAADGRPSADGTQWTFSLGGLVRGAIVDIVLVPGSGAFSVAFNKPDEEAIATTTRSSDTEPSRPAPSEQPVVALRPPATFAAPPDPQPRIAEPEVLAAPPAGVAARDLDEEIVPYPAPTDVVTPASGGRPIALLALIVVAAAWIWRDRIAERAAAGHELSQPLALERDASVLRRAESTLAGDR